MDIGEVRRKLKGLGVPMNRVCIVPLGSKVGGWERDSKINLIEMPDGFLLASYERGKVRGESFFASLDGALNLLAGYFDQDPEQRRKAAEKWLRLREQYGSRGQ